MLTLQYAGLGARSSLLDGGLPAWKKGNRPVTTEVPAAARPGTLSARPTALLFAAQTLGYDIKLYDGSFQDWSRRGLPVEHSRKDDK